MQKTLKSADYGRLIALLVAARHQAGMTQHDVAKVLARPQSFIAKYEGGERRLDILEFIRIAQALRADPLNLLARFLEESDASAVRITKRSSPSRRR